MTTVRDVSSWEREWPLADALQRDLDAPGSESPPPQPRRKARICVLFTGAPGPADRGWNADAGQMEAMKARLAKAEKDLGNVELIIGQSDNPEQTAAFLKQAGPKTPSLPST